eukprot:2975019-Pyramimonas_sp.AAC.1
MPRAAAVKGPVMPRAGATRPRGKTTSPASSPGPAAVAAQDANFARGLAEDARGTAPSAAGKGGFRKSSHKCKTRDDKYMMAMFYMTDSESGASEMQVQVFDIPQIQEEEENNNKSTDAAVAKAQGNGPT